MEDILNSKRKRDVGDNEGRELKKLHVEDGRPGIEALHKDVGEKYLLCRTRKAPNLTVLSATLLYVLCIKMSLLSLLHIIYDKYLVNMDFNEQHILGFSQTPHKTCSASIR